MKTRTASELWNEYLKINPSAPESYAAWAFGDSEEMASELATLVLEGTKTATASNYQLYELENEPLPHAGLHNILLDGNGAAVAVLITTAVEVVPFDEVTGEHAYLEGEGDRTLRHWRHVHELFFKKELEALEIQFDYKMPVVCERFEVVYK